MTDEKISSASQTRLFLASSPSPSPPAAHAFDARRKNMMHTMKNAADAAKDKRYIIGSDINMTGVNSQAINPKNFYLAVRFPLISTSSASSQSFSSLYVERFSSVKM